MAESSHTPAAEPEKDVQIQADEQPAGSGEAVPNHDQVEGKWCKVFTSKTTNAEGREYYFSNLETGESSWEEPEAAYWLWDYGTQTYHVSGLQQPTSRETLEKEKAVRDDESGPLSYDDKDPANGWQGYNPRVHGPYDKTKPYSAYHSWLAFEKEHPAAAAGQQPQTTDHQMYGSTARFNSLTGRFQTDEQSADRHDAASKAGRQMSAFFDVDSAANSHDGRSLKEERRNNKPSKQEIAEMNQKRKEKKQQKRLAFYKS